MPSIKVLDAASTTTFIQTFQNAGGTTLMASVPIDASGTALIGGRVSAGSMPVVIASDQAAFPVQLAAGTAVFGTVSFAVATSFAVVAAAGAVAPVAVKSAAGTVFGLNLFCTNTVNAVYLRLYNLATGSVNGTSVPSAIFGVPSGGVNNATIPVGGVGFGTAISYQITKLGVANDTTAVNASDIVGWITYI